MMAAGFARGPILGLVCHWLSALVGSGATYVAANTRRHMGVKCDTRHVLHVACDTRRDLDVDEGTR